MCRQRGWHWDQILHAFLGLPSEFRVLIRTPVGRLSAARSSGQQILFFHLYPHIVDTQTLFPVIPPVRLLRVAA